MANMTRYAGQAAKRFSPALWGNLFAQLSLDPNLGVLWYDDFVNHPAHISAQSIGNYATYIDTGVTLKQNAIVTLANEESGVLEVAGNDAANDEGHIATGGNSGAFCKISDESGEARGVYFEARIKKASIADATSGFFIGLTEEGLAAADSLVDTTLEVASKDMIGFQQLAADGELVHAIYRKAGQTKQTVVTNAATLVADTWVQLGFRYQPWAPTEKRIAFFVNGVEQSSYVTGTNIAAATFPDGEELAMSFLTKCAAGAESKLHMDWWAAAQLFTEHH